MILKNLVKKVFLQQSNIECQDNKLSSESEICEDCGHDVGAHLLKCTGSPITDGWIECPVSGCNCHKVWNLSLRANTNLKRVSAS